MDKKAIFLRELNFAALSFWLVGSVVMAATALLWYGQDFRGYYAAALVVINGGNPYDYSTLAPFLLRATGVIGNNPYYYAPFFAWFIIPFSWLPFNIARICWMSFNLILWNFSLWQLSNLLNWPKTGWRRWFLFLLATIIFAWITWRYEQTGIILFALLVAALVALQKKNGVAAGIWLALLLIKPNITLIPVLAIVFWLIRHRNWKPVISLGITIIGLLAIAFMVTPNLINPFLEPDFGQGLFSTLDGPGRIVGTRINTTLRDWLLMFHVSSETTRAVSVMALLLGLVILAIIVWRTNSIYIVVIVSLLVNYAITPYALQYDYPLLTLVFFWAIALIQYGRKSWINMVGAAIALFIISIPFWEHPISDGYWIVIGLIGITSCCWYNADKSLVPPDLFHA